MTHTHFFDLNNIRPQHVTAGGSRLSLTNKEFPILKHLSLALVKIAPGCTREPHWHPNAGEMGYCLKGKALMTVFTPGNGHEKFTMNPGDLSFVPKGSIHDIVNIGDEELQFLLAFSQNQPEDLDISTAVHSMSDRVLAATFGVKESFFDSLKKSPETVFITGKGPLPSTENLPTTSRFKLNIDRINPQIITKGGSAKIANTYTFPTVKDLCMFSLRVNKNAVREPHWHPNADELNYVISGKARLTILSPGNKIDTYEVGPGAGSYIPASYFHHIENIGEEELRMAVFFSNALPDDIGISGAMGAYSNAELASVFGVSVKDFDKFPHIQEDLMIVAGGG